MSPEVKITRLDQLNGLRVGQVKSLKEAGLI